MITAFIICAVAGSVILLCQFALSVIGMDADHADIADIGDDLEMGDEYVDAHGGSSLFFDMLSFRSVTAAVAFFGLGGLAGNEAGLSTYLVFLSAISAAVLAMVVVAWLMRLLYTMKSEGTVRIENCIGLEANVYLSIPGNGSGTGKVTVSVQNREMEYSAVTEKEEIPTGSRVVVVGVSAPGTLEVVPEDKV